MKDILFWRRLAGFTLLPICIVLTLLEWLGRTAEDLRDRLRYTLDSYLGTP